MASYLITGTSRGIGLALCEALAAKPSSEVSVVFAAYRTYTDDLKHLVAKSNGRIEAVAMDVTDEAQIKEAAVHVEKALKTKGLDVLINNAGVAPLTPGGITTMEDLESTFTINVMGVHWVTRSFIPLLERGNLKKIINLSTTIGSITLANGQSHVITPAYKVTKAALNMLTVQYSMELAGKGYTVAALSPGWVKTDLGGKDFADLEMSEAIPAITERILGAGKGDNGKFLDVKVPGWEQKYNGGNPPW